MKTRTIRNLLALTMFAATCVSVSPASAQTVDVMVNDVHTRVSVSFLDCDIQAVSAGLGGDSFFTAQCEAYFIATPGCFPGPCEAGTLKKVGLGPVTHVNVRSLDYDRPRSMCYIESWTVDAVAERIVLECDSSIIFANGFD